MPSKELARDDISIQKQPKKTVEGRNEVKRQHATTNLLTRHKSPTQTLPKPPRVYLKPKAVSFKPLYTIDNKSKDSEKPAYESNTKMTLASLKVLFGAEILPYLDQFEDQIKHTCCALVLSGILSVFKIVLIAFAVAWTAVFNNRTLIYIQKAFTAVFDETEDNREKKMPTMMAATVQAMSSSVYCLYFFGSISIVGEVVLIVSIVLRQSWSMALSLVATFITHFWVITLLYAISITAIESKDISGGFIGNLALRDFANHKGGRVFHNFQENFKCCGFNEGPIDWHKNIAFNWSEPSLNEERSFFNDFKWSSTCPVEISCLTPISCCKKHFIPNNENENPSENCNRASVSRLTYDQLRSNRKEMLEMMEPKYPDQINTKPCVPLIAKRLDRWAYPILGVAIALFFCWGCSIWLVTLTFAEISGMGSIDPHTRMPDPGTLQNIVPFRALVDSKWCCGSPENWPLYEANSEREAVRDDFAVFTAIEKGKNINTVDLNTNSNFISLFMPRLTGTRNLTATKSKQVPKKDLNKQTAELQETEKS